MFVAVAEVFDAYAIDVLVIGGASDVDLAEVDEFLKEVFFSPWTRALHEGDQCPWSAGGFGHFARGRRGCVGGVVVVFSW